MSARLIRAIDEYCAEQKVAPSTFGRRSVRDPRIVTDLKSGRRISQSREARIWAFMREAAQ